MNIKSMSMALGVALLTLPGCGSVYTNIERAGPNTYLVTRIKQGFLTVYGDLYICAAAENETTMTCRHIGEP
jgi:hypothetical protein